MNLNDATTRFLIKAFSGLTLAYAISFAGSAYHYPNHLSWDLPIIVLKHQGTGAPIGSLISAGGGILFLMLVLFLKKKEPKLGFARWGNKADVKKAGLDAEHGTVMGRLCIPKIHKDMKLPNPQLMKVSSTNVYLRYNAPLAACAIAPPGVGKTTAFVIPALLENDQSMIVHDPKGELFEKTAPYRATFSKVLRFDPMGEGKSVTFNPFCASALPKEDFKNYFKFISPT